MSPWTSPGATGRNTGKAQISAGFPDKAPEVMLGLNSNPNTAFFNLLRDLGQDTSLNLTLPLLKWKEYKHAPAVV